MDVPGIETGLTRAPLPDSRRPSLLTQPLHTKATIVVTIQDDAERLRAIASSDAIPIGILSNAENQLLEVNAQVLSILRQGSDHANRILGLTNAAAEAISNARAALQAVESAIHDAADHHGS